MKFDLYKLRSGAPLIPAELWVHLNTSRERNGGSKEIISKTGNIKNAHSTNLDGKRFEAKKSKRESEI